MSNARLRKLNAGRRRKPGPAISDALGITGRFEFQTGIRRLGLQRGQARFALWGES